MPGTPGLLTWLKNYNSKYYLLIYYKRKNTTESSNIRMTGYAGRRMHKLEALEPACKWLVFFTSKVHAAARLEAYACMGEEVGTTRPASLPCRRELDKRALFGLWGSVHALMHAMFITLGAGGWLSKSKFQRPGPTGPALARYQLGHR